MKTQVSNDFILEAYKNACCDWKLRIEKECPELFKRKLEIGKWYKGFSELGSSFLGVYDKDKKVESDIVYGFWNKKWSNNENGLIFINDAKLYETATEEEVKESLINEAEKRGFKKGVIIDKLLGFNVGSSDAENARKAETSVFTFSNDLNYIYLNNLVIFKKGKWAEIISNPIEEKINDLQKQIDELKKQLL